METVTLSILYYVLIGGSSIALIIALARSRGGAAPVGAFLHDALEAAFLSGGPGRVADTVITAMHEDGRLVVGWPGIVSIRQGAAAHNPAESALITAHSAAPNGALHQLRVFVMRSPAVQSIGDGLAARGLLIQPGALRPIRRWAITQILLCLAGFPLAIVLTFVQFAHYDGYDFALPFVFQVFPAVLFGIVVGAVCSARAGKRLTGAGQSALRQYAASPAARTGSAAHLVAMGGPRAVPDPELRSRLAAAARTRVSVGGSSSSGSSSSASHDASLWVGGTVIWCGGGGSGGGSSCGGSSCGGSSCGSSSGGSSCGGSSGGSSCGGSSGGSSCGGGGSS
ncbi:TIGR04222 domain-containing membrane protein [Streptomyces sp. PSKA54]|uniref:TIGR04222 domain-containing membrane protein n=1 Tax=Streptomyces himalayensis subsp. aureolus TaxID=2758039 RepID=A0A7W2HHN3_9ACTN|nr:TIGR04222 domain-containing membrane protein [Streptomyces himalayensis]MBA4864151.1 TIGR04222 domain-containing membrane protein [Streptomyces himalayensis subsp. aureolus]